MCPAVPSVSGGWVKADGVSPIRATRGEPPRPRPPRPRPRGGSAPGRDERAAGSSLSGGPPGGGTGSLRLLVREGPRIDEHASFGDSSNDRRIARAQTGGEGVDARFRRLDGDGGALK